MKYIIYLDEHQIETFESDEVKALENYKSLCEEFKGEEVYDNIELFELKSVKKESLEVKEDEKI